MNIEDIKQELIEYRNKLNINNELTFGIEIEYKKAWDKKINHQIKKQLDNKEWFAKYDGTVSIRIWKQLFGGEINSPILTNTQENWENIEIICNILKNNKAYINYQCGGHIHIGSYILNNDLEQYLKLIKLWFMYEPIIYRFAYGEYRKGRSGIKLYAKSQQNNMKRILDEEKMYLDIKTLLENLKVSRNYGINFLNANEGKNTIEFRCQNSTLEPIIWQNNINFFSHLLEATKTVQIDEEKLKYKLNQNNQNFNNIEIEEAIELANIIFTEEIDKLYFLRQYIKDGIITNEFEKSKIFIK